MASDNTGDLILPADLNLQDEILTKIKYSTNADEKLDVESLFSAVENILDRTTKTVDGLFLKGTDSQETKMKLLEEESPQESFIPPLSAFKIISYEMQCKAAGEQIAPETTVLSIIEKLSSYSRDAKAVLTLATFALEYGEYFLLACIQSSNQVAKSMGTLKGVPVLLGKLEKHSQAVVDLNKLIKATLAVFQCIFGLKKLSNYDKKDKLITVAVYWAIVSVVVSTNQICYFITDDQKKKQELETYADKLNRILSELKKERANQEKEDYREVKNVVETSVSIVAVINILLTDPTNKLTPQLTDGSTDKMVEITSLERKSVFLFFSSLHISGEDISNLENCLNKMRKDQYETVWIPFVKQWTKDLEKKFEFLRSKMLYVAANYSLPIASHKYIIKKWNFKVNEPLIVVLNPQGKVVCMNAIPMMRVCGVEAFPFTSVEEETLLNQKGLIGLTATDISSDIKHWIEERKYILLYGGQLVTDSAMALDRGPMILEKGISIELVSIENDNLLKRFWTKIKNLFTSRSQRETEIDSMKLDIEKLISYKKKKRGWAVFSKGSSVILIGGTTILQVLKEFDKWKENLNEKDFELAFKDYHNMISNHDDDAICRHIKIPYKALKIPETECSHCQRIMVTYITFKCCHKDDNTWALPRP
ncbi:protein SIEVE ELEMENT OCCLUSION B-like isoform X1 [Quercus robur]|uniref:protein SIEVE ELEMENT OCCLUSION B-like isoform X1 n=1 Tax=Quercus robur TaxID=38942 RepID=UPI002163CC8A|nr:protein SIEVE ELEMENT OCCLUSION B-like isoform X1 [Quercus robur]